MDLVAGSTGWANFSRSTTGVRDCVTGRNGCRGPSVLFSIGYSEDNSPPGMLANANSRASAPFNAPTWDDHKKRFFF